jgi:hypothetical protein
MLLAIAQKHEVTIEVVYDAGMFDGCYVIYVNPDGDAGLTYSNV